MKKIVRAMAGALLVLPLVARAYTMGTFGAGVLVPYVIHNGPAETTAVGLVTGDASTCPFYSYTSPSPLPSPSATANIEWFFFDADSNVRQRGRIEVTNNDVHPFIWALESDPALEGVAGYLLFILDTDGLGRLDRNEGRGACLTAEAFLAVVAEDDVAYIPTWPVEADDFAEVRETGHLYLDTMGPDSLTHLASGAPDLYLGSYTDSRGEPARYALRYSIGNGDTTRIVLWSAEAIAGSYVAPGFDDEENSKSLMLALPHEELNVIDPAQLTGLPAEFVNGYIQWDAPRSAGNQIHASADCDPAPGAPPATYTDHGCDGNGVVSFSIIHSPGLGARQTILNAARLHPGT